MGKLIWASDRVRAELAYCVPKGIPYSTFLGWSDEDRNAALDFEAAMRTVCRSCGTRAAEWAEDRFAYVGQFYSCPGCEVIDQERRNVPESALPYTQIYLAPLAEARMPDGTEGG